MTPLNLKITKGCIIVNQGFDKHKNGRVILLEVDLKSKYSEVIGFSGGEGEFPCVLLDATAETRKLSDIETATTIDFLDYEGWSVYLADVSKYTLRVCLTYIND